MSIVPINGYPKTKYALYLAETRICNHNTCDTYLIPMFKKVESIPRNIVNHPPGPPNNIERSDNVITTKETRLCTNIYWICPSASIIDVSFIKAKINVPLYQSCGLISYDDYTIEYEEATATFDILIKSASNDLKTPAYYQLLINNAIVAYGSIPRKFPLKIPYNAKITMRFSGQTITSGNFECITSFYRNF